jgi:guanine deaminase
MDSIHEQFLQRAITLGLEGMRRVNGGPFGAVIVADGIIIGEACNLVLSTNDPTAHAEVGAIRLACAKLGRFHLEDATLYSSCEPCPMCLAAIYWARIGSIYYAATRHDAAAAGFADEHLYEEIGRLPANRDIPFTRIPLPQATAAFAEFNEMPDKLIY